MPATDKVMVAVAIAGVCLIAAIVESAHPGFLACFCVAFIIGGIAAEAVRARRRQTIRTDWKSLQYPAIPASASVQRNAASAGTASEG